MKDKDTQLINRTLEGDDNAFAELVEKHKKKVHALVWRKTGDFHVAEEITQDTFLQAYHNLATLKQTQSFSSWLHVIALRCCNMWFRKKYRRTQLMQDKDTHNPEEATYSSYVHEENQRFSIEAQREVVKKLLAKLEECERTVMTLHYFGDMSCSEIGKFMGVSTNTIKSRLRRAQQRLQKEETMIREALDNFKITPNLTETIMRKISRTKLAAPSGSKPLVPWTVAASTLAVVLLMLGFGNQQYLERFQKLYSLDVIAEMTVDIIDAPIVANLESKPDVRRQIGSANALDKRNNPEQQPNDASEYDETIMDTALDLDGSLSCVEIKDSETLNNITEQLTVSLWIRPTSNPNRYTTILSKSDLWEDRITHRSFIMNYKEGGSIQFAASPEGEGEASLYSPYSVIKHNTWTHVAGVIDAEKNYMKLYINGIEVSSRDFKWIKKIYKSYLPLRIGWSHENRPAQSPFVGQMDDVRIWNIARSDADIRNDMITELNGDEPGLVGYWKFNKVTDGIISDMSPNRNDGSLVGNPKLTEYIRPVSALTSEEQLTKAAVAYQKLLSDGTNYYEVFRYLAEIYIKTERFVDAEKVYLHALEVDLTQNEQNDAISDLWQLYAKRDAVEEFITLLEELKPRMEGSSVLHELLGDAYMDVSEEDKAELAYTQWINIRIKEVDRENRSAAYRNLAEELLRKNLFPEKALELAENAFNMLSGTKYKITLAHAFLINEMYEDAFQRIHSFLNSGYYEYTERDMFERIVKAGKNIKDEDGYVEMLNNLIDVSELDLPAQLNTIMALAQFYKANNQYEKAEALVQKTGFMTEEVWMTLGPFENVDRIGFNTEYIPENLQQIDTTVKYGGKNGQVSWQKCPDDFIDGCIRILPNVNWSVAYSFATIHSPDERKVEFRFDSDDQGKVWVNGIEVHAHTRIYATDIDRDIIPVTLFPGNNSILIKVCEETRGSGFYLRITDENGKPFDDLVFSNSARER